MIQPTLVQIEFHILIHITCVTFTQLVILAKQMMPGMPGKYVDKKCRHRPCKGEYENSTLFKSCVLHYYNIHYSGPYLNGLFQICLLFLQHFYNLYLHILVLQQTGLISFYIQFFVALQQYTMVFSGNLSSQDALTLHHFVCSLKNENLGFYLFMLSLRAFLF